MKVRLLSIMLALFMLASLFAFSSCFGKDDTPDVDPNDEAYKAIYQLYYEYETANGNEPTEYEQWLATIRGKDGKDGEDGISPMLRINPDTDYWEISTNNGLDWSSLEVKAIGENGKDGVTPQLRITDSYWEVSYDNGSTWLPLGEKATGEKGEEGNGILKIEFDKNGSLVITYTNGKTETVSMPEKEEHIHKYDDWTLISAINSLYCRTCSECNNTEWKQDETATSEVVWSVIGNILGTDWNYDFVMSLVDEGTWRSDEFNLHIGDSFKIRKDFSYDYYFGKDGMHNAEPYPITTDGIYKIEFKWDELSDSAVIDLIPVHLHTYDSVTVIAPTCTENGYTVYECACTYQYRGEYVTALGHTEVVDEGITATCAREGLTQGSHYDAWHISSRVDVSHITKLQYPHHAMSIK